MTYILRLSLSPASNRIFQSLLLKLESMRFQKMSAPCDRERAWRSWGTAREASWQNSDFNMDHRLHNTHVTLDTNHCGGVVYILKKKICNNLYWKELSTAHTLGWASFPGCRPETGDDPCGQGTNTLHGDTLSSDSSAYWTRCQAPQTWTFPENTELCDSVCSFCLCLSFNIHSFRTSTCRTVYISFKDTGSCW